MGPSPSPRPVRLAPSVGGFWWSGSSPGKRRGRLCGGATVDNEGSGLHTEASAIVDVRPKGLRSMAARRAPLAPQLGVKVIGSVHEDVEDPVSP